MPGFDKRGERGRRDENNGEKSGAGLEGSPVEKAFERCRVSASALALEAIPRDESILALRRHAQRDWGILSAEDKAARDKAFQEGRPVLSAYRSKAGVEFWILTDQSMSATIVLLPRELD